MKFISVRDAKATLSGTIEDSQGQKVVITKHGKPVYILIGCDGYDIEDVLTVADSAFWEMIEKRRAKGRTRSLASLRERFARKDAAASRKRAKSRKKPRQR